MKKVLITILIILLVVLAYFAIFNGLSFANMKILSVEEIIEANDNLTDNIEQAKSLLTKDYPTKKEELSTSVEDLLNKKKEYFGLAKISTDTEISKANTEETYLREFLWTRIGNHATAEGVNMKMDEVAGNMGEAEFKNLSFTAKGYYFGIMNFVSALENDDKLNFKIENFKMVQDEDLLSATFIVRNVRIKQETASTTNATTQSTQDNANSAEDNQDTTTGDTSKLDQVTGTVEGALAPEESTQEQ